MKDVRYVGLTAICIFLALAIGLILGSALGGPGVQAKVYDGLRRQFEALAEEITRVREENDQAKRRLGARDQAIRDLLPMALRGRLPGSLVGVVICGQWDERPFWGELESAISAAGAELGPVLRIPDQVRPLTTGQRSRLGAYWQSEPLAPEPDSYEAVTWAVRALVRGSAPERLEELTRSAGMELRNPTERPIRRLLVLVSIPDETRQEAVKAGQVPEIRVVDAAKAEPNVRIVAAEPEDLPASAVELLRRRGIPTVDNIDTASGQLSAILALAGAEGSFGSKPGASRPIPALE